MPYEHDHLHGYGHSRPRPRVDWLVLALCSLLTFGNYYAFDIPASIARQLQHYLSLDDPRFAYDLNLYYAAYSLPNIILPLLSGALLDHPQHLHRATLLLAALTLCGHMVFATGVVGGVRWVAVVGRLVFGVGGESLSVAQSVYTTRWFGDRLTSESSVVSRGDGTTGDGQAIAAAARPHVDVTADVSAAIDVVVEVPATPESDNRDSFEMVPLHRHASASTTSATTSPTGTHATTPLLVVDVHNRSTTNARTATSRTTSPRRSRSRRRRPRPSPPSLLALSLGLNIAVGRLGSVVNDLISPQLAVHWNSPVTTTSPSTPTATSLNGVKWALAAGVLTCMLSMACALALVWLDRRRFGDGEEVAMPRVKTGLSRHVVFQLDDGDDEADGARRRDSGRRTALSSSLLRESSGQRTSPSTLRERSAHTPSPILRRPDRTTRAVTLMKRARKAMFGVIARLALVVIVVYASCLYPNHTRHHRHLLFHQVTPFNTIHAAFLQRRFAMDPVTAAQIIGIPDTISMILTPFTGSFVDRFGKRVHLLLLCSLILTGVHATFLDSWHWTPFNPLLPLTLLGIAYALLLLVWSTIPLLVPGHLTGIAFGLATCILNLALTVAPMVVAGLMATDATFRSVEVWFMACGVSAMWLGVWLMVVDRRMLGGVLARAGGTSQAVESGVH